MGLLRRLFGRRERAEASMARALALIEAGDPVGAVAIWTTLAHRGHARARNNLGACLAEGRGVERDLARARHWIGLAAEAGDLVAQRNRAALVFGGGEPDDAEAARLYRVAAENGDAVSQDMLSWMLLDGDGLDPDPSGARHWAERAAAAGVASAMTRLGVLHDEGRGVPPDPEKAASFWRRAADRGDSDAQARLGMALLRGSGLPGDPVAALAWLIRSQDGGLLRAPAVLLEARGAVDADGCAEAERRAALPLPKPTGP